MTAAELQFSKIQNLRLLYKCLWANWNWGRSDLDSTAYSGAFQFTRAQNPMPLPSL
jgi:hypothetical protein